MNEKTADSVDEAIEEVADQTEEGLEEVKESLAKAQRSMENAKAALHDAAGKARDTAAVAAEKAALVDHDPFDSRNVQSHAYRLVPYIYSAGPNGIYDINFEPEYRFVDLKLIQLCFVKYQARYYSQFIYRLP